jgi:sugar lactone lactonase YvrE
VRIHRFIVPITLAILALLAVWTALAYSQAPAQAAAPLAPAEDCYIPPLPRDCGGINPSGAPVPACCAFGYVFDADAGALSGALVTATTQAGVVFTATTVPGPHSCAAYFTLDLEGRGVNVGDPITLTTRIGGGVGGRARTIVYTDVLPGGQQIDLVVPRPDRSEAWTLYLTDTLASVTALALDGDYLWVGSGGQGAARLGLSSGAALTYVRPVTAPSYNDVRSLALAGDGSVWWATAGGGAVRLDAAGPLWEQYKVYNSGVLGNYLGGVALDSEGAHWFAGWAPTQALVYTVAVDNMDPGFSSVGATYVEDSWTGSCRGVQGDARWTPSRQPGYTDDVDWAVYTPTLPSAGAYRVYVHFPRFYTEFAGLPRQDTANARYQVTHDGGVSTVTIVQDGNWCQWVLLGEFDFTPGAGHRVYLGDYTNGEDPRRVVLADAVKWVHVSDGLEIIVDDSDGDANFGMSNPAAWTVQTDPWNPDGCRPVGRSAEWMVSRYPGYTDDVYWAWWRPDLPYDGPYDVEMILPRFYTGLSDTSSALYKVHHTGETTVVPRAQTDHWCTWTSLGRFTFEPGTTGSVYLGNYTGENPQTSLILDAVRWVYREGTSLGGVGRLTGTTWLTDTTPGDSRALAFDAAGTLWVGTSTGLARRDPDGGWDIYTHATSGLPLAQVTALATDDVYGRLWLGDAIGGGLAVYTPTTGLWQSFTSPFTDVAAIAVDNAGLVWIGSVGSGGLAVLRPDGSWITYTAANSALPGDRVLALLADPTGGVWIGATAAGAGQHSGVARLVIGTPPIATIQALKPGYPVQTRDAVEFRAGALDTDENGASILRYEWTSSLMTAPLGSTARFTLPASALPAGQHTIGLRALDNEGTWSAPVETTLRVTPPRSWRFLLYLDGDNNLAPYLEQALRQLEQADLPPQVTVLALFDGPTANDTYRYEVQPGGVYQDGVNRWHLAEANMGSYQTLRDFITWARASYPADYTYLAIADHGRGTQGVAWDDSSGQDELLTPLELREALRLATADGAQPVEVLHLDACLMGLLEQAHQVAPYAGYFVASENLAWAVFPYADYAQSVGDATAPAKLASGVALSYSARLSGTLGYPHTIAALDLGVVPTVTAAVDDLATALIAALPGAHAAISQAWTAAQRFDSRYYYVINTQDEYVDLFDLAGRLSTTVTNTAVVSAATALQSARDELVLAERHLSGPADVVGATHEWHLDGARGLALYFPPDNAVWGYEDYLMGTFRFTEDTAWDEFLLAYLGPAAQPPLPPEEPGRPPVPGAAYRVFLPVVGRQFP